MKTINITFEDKEHKELMEIKGDTSWHDFIVVAGRKQRSKDGTK